MSVADAPTPETLGPLRADHPSDPVVARQRTRVFLALGFSAIVFVAVFLLGVVLFQSPVGALGGGFLFVIINLVVLATPPADRPRTGGLAWTLYALLHPRRRVRVHADGFVVSDGPVEHAYRWEDVRAITYPAFDDATWAQPGTHTFFVQRAKRLTLQVNDDWTVTLTDHLKDVEDLTALIQEEVYARQLDGLRRTLAAGEQLAFGRFSMSRSGVAVGDEQLSWDEIAELALKEGRFVLRKHDAALNLLNVGADVLGNLPLLLALVAEVRPEFGRSLRAGLPLDAPAQMWRRAARLREQGTAADEPALDEVPDHGGKPLPVDADFFAPAPTEIGTLVSAYTTLRAVDEPKELDTRLLITLFAAALGAGIGLGIIFVFSVRSDVWRIVWETLPTLGAAAIAWLSTAFVHTCTYVGTLGVARLGCARRRERLVEQSVFLFDSADEVRTTLTVRRNKGNYEGTDYAFVWTGPLGREAFRIKGTFKSENNAPPSTDEYHFGESAEVAWSLYLLDVLAEQVKTFGHADFRLTKGDFIRVGAGFVAFHVKGEATAWEAGDLAEMSSKEGRLRFRRADAQVGWFRSTGVFEFASADLANVMVFLFLLRTLVAFGALLPARDPKPLRRFVDQLDRASWHGDPRAAAFIRSSLPEDAARSALESIQTK